MYKPLENIDVNFVKLLSFAVVIGLFFAYTQGIILGIIACFIIILLGTFKERLLS